MAKQLFGAAAERNVLVDECVERRFRSAGAKNLIGWKSYKHSVTPGLSDLTANFHPLEVAILPINSHDHFNILVKRVA